MCLFFRQHKILKIMSCLEYEYVNYWQHTVITSISKYKIIKSILIYRSQLMIQIFINTQI